MSRVPEAKTAEIIENVVLLVRARLPENQAIQVEPFVRQYYAETAAEDLQESEVGNLYGAVLAHWNLAKQYQPGQPKIHVYNPRVERHGWQATHTIIEIVSDDMPFLVDSVRMALNARGLTNHLVIHPVIRIHRDARGIMQGVLEPNGVPAEGAAEAIMHFEVDRQTEEGVLAGIREDLARVLRDVRVAVEDWAAMRERARVLRVALSDQPPPASAEELAETRAFLQWIEEDHFTFLGYREYQLHEENGEEVLRSVAGSGLGILRNPGVSAVSGSFAALPPAIRRLARSLELLIVTKGDARSTVHRPGYLDYIGIKKITPAGEVIGEWRFLGLFTSAAYNRVPRAIPLLRQKVAKVLVRADYRPNSHAYKHLVQILEDFPRDQLFQIGADELFDIAIGILHLQERQRTRLFVHRDRFGRFFSCLIYVPRERFSTEIRQRMRAILEESLHGEGIDFNVQLSESVLARVHFIIRIPRGILPEYDVRQIEARLVEITRTWKDDLGGALLEYYGEEQGTRLFRCYGDAFRADYRENYPPRIAVHDIEQMETLCPQRCLAMSLYRPLEAPEDWLRFKLYRLGSPIPLSDALPMLEHMGLKVIDETPSRIRRSQDNQVWIHDFGLTHSEGELDLDLIKDIFQDAFARVWSGEVESDGFNRLVLRARLSWREVVLLRVYCKYLRQTTITFSQAYIEQALTNNPHIARLLVTLFHARFDPAPGPRPKTEEQLGQEIEKALDVTVASLDEDRILRSFLDLIQATLRSNFYQLGNDQEPKPYLAFKLDPARIVELPEPRPLFEIFVYAPRMEGIHLRGAKIARGGLRWSDRREDFRTEILGLVKAQMVKNAVIVPMGAKGGFVPKRLPSGTDREAVVTEVVACYRTFIQGLLDVTDNLVGGQVVPPPRVIRHDDDDPYLVVAADKGTATFSDLANEVAKEYGFWLGDAFASGGSSGYDHKKMGITARGVWECVKRHFRELGIAARRSDFTVVGIGDMSGDVFGNGMLFSEHIKLIAAFNHQHIFLDPTPDPQTSYQERKRLFALPRSSWADYDKAALSKGGGVYPRSAKSIVLSPEARQALHVEAVAMIPSELIRAILCAPVDLLWSGGIGTFVKASDELDSAVGDRTNDAIRVSANALRCRMVGEGGNLGFTQRGRIEYATKGGRLNTDAIDNSGGVDCSDHEVNIKILLDHVVASGDMTEKQRNRILVEMTDEVAVLVLRNNYLQSETLSVARVQAPSLVEVHGRMIQTLERKGRLKRALEFLPSEEVLAERRAANQGLTSPELAVLLAHSKIDLVEELMSSEVPEDPYLLRELERYFPVPLRKRFGKQIAAHPLAREIVSTQVANELVNRAGISFIFGLTEETDVLAPEVTRAYIVARDVFEMETWWAEVEALDDRVPAEIQLAMLAEGHKLLERAARWLLRRRSRPLAIAASVAHFAPGVASLRRGLAQWMTAANRPMFEQTAARYLEAGVPEPLARRVVSFNELLSTLDVVEVANATQRTVEDVAAIYFRLFADLELPWLRDQIAALPRENHWQALARTSLRDDLYSQQNALTLDVLATAAGLADGDAPIEAWMAANRSRLQRFQQVLADLKCFANPDLAMLSVAVGELRRLRSPEVFSAGDVQSSRSRPGSGQDGLTGQVTSQRLSGKVGEA